MSKRAPTQLYLAEVFCLLGFIFPTYFLRDYFPSIICSDHYYWLWGLSMEVQYHSEGYRIGVYWLHFSWFSDDIGYSNFFRPNLFLLVSFLPNLFLIICIILFIGIIHNEIRNLNQEKPYHNRMVVNATILLIIIVFFYFILLFWGTFPIWITIPISLWSFLLATILAFEGNKIAIHYLPIWEESQRNYENRYRKSNNTHK